MKRALLNIAYAVLASPLIVWGWLRAWWYGE